LRECRKSYISSSYFILDVAVRRYLIEIVRLVEVERWDIRVVFIIAIADQINLKAVVTLDVADRGEVAVIKVLSYSRSNSKFRRKKRYNSSR